MTIGERIRARRKHLGLTQEQLAALSGLSLSCVGKIERGERKGLRPDTILGLSTALKMTVRSLICY
jgi:transcriptional regulator with XRE-family HTH domain